MTSPKQPEADYAACIMAAWILAPFGLLALIMGVDQIHALWVAAFGGQEWK